MTTWIIPEEITEITKQYIQNMPKGTTKIVILEGVQSIGDEAFKNCTSLKSIMIPCSVQSIGNGAFWGCTNLESIVIHGGVQSIGHATFRGCTSLKKIEIPSSVQSIGAQAFYGCTNLESIMITKSIESIGAYTFRGCTSLKRIEIPSSVQSICFGAFDGCTSLKSIMIPDCVRWIQDRTFQGCGSLNLIVLPNVLVKNRSRYGIADDQVVLSYSDLAQWKTNNGLENKSYSDHTVLFLYQLQNIESFTPSWNEVLKQCPELGLDDLINFSGDKQDCKPAWAREGYMGFSNNTVGLEDISIRLYCRGNEVFNRFNELGNVLSGYLQVNSSAVLSCVSGIKEISICPASSQSLNAESLSPNHVGTKIENYANTEEGPEVSMGYENLQLNRR